MDVTRTIETKDPYKTNLEVKRIFNQHFNSASFDKVEQTLNDVIKLFEGKYPGYLKCDMRYHDLEHTLQVYLAVARIFDGLIQSNHSEISEEYVLLGLIAALGHDTGFIKELWDTEGSGAKYTLIHEIKSEEFMGKYLPKLRFNSSQIKAVQNMISCTGMPPKDLSKIHFTSKREEEAGYILGTADYLAQMSDPDYVKKLPLLYDEFRESDITLYKSPQDLIEKTPQFFKEYVMKLFIEDFHSIFQYVSNHFGGQNLYMEGIERNIGLIESNSYLGTRKGHSF